MQRFRVDLKTLLGLAMPNQCCHAVTKLVLGWFVGETFGQEIPNLSDPYMGPDLGKPFQIAHQAQSN